MRSIVKAVSLNKYYDQFHALKDIDIEVEQGEVLCIIGPSGSGKSTLLRCVNQLEKIDKGGLWVDGELVGYRIVGNKLHELNESQIARQRLATGMVFQRFNLFPHMTVLQNIIEGPCQVLKRSPKEAHEEALELLARVGLADKRNSYPIELSGGQQQRVAIARALAMRPKLMLFDEPTSALDPELVGEVLSGMTDTAERQASVTFIDYFTSGPQFYTLQKNKDINEATDLCGRKVGTSRRTTFPAEIAEFSKANCEASGKPAIVVIGTEGSADARAQLRQSRIDAAMQGSETLSYLKTQEKDMYKTVGQPITVQLTGLGVSKKKPELSEAVKVALQSMIDDGSYLAILKKWELELGAIKTVTINAGK